MELVDVADPAPQAQSREGRPGHRSSLLFDVELGELVHDTSNMDVDEVADEGSRLHSS